MAKRFYSVQVCDQRSGWQDIGIFSKKEFLCNDAALEYSEKHNRVSRVVQKPHNFEPGDSDTVLK